MSKSRYFELECIFDPTLTTSGGNFNTNLVFYYPLTNGNFNDSSGNGLTPALEGTSGGFPATGGKFTGTYYKFSTNGHWRLGSARDPNYYPFICGNCFDKFAWDSGGWTLSYWLRNFGASGLTSAECTLMRLDSNNTPTNLYSRLFVAAPREVRQVGNCNDYFSCLNYFTGTLPDAEQQGWNHYVWRYNPYDKSLRFYRNTIQKNVWTLTASQFNSVTRFTYTVTMCQCNSPGTNAGIQEMAFWRVPLDVADIQYIYNSGTGRTIASLIA